MYAKVSDQPRGGWPSVKGKSHDIPWPFCRAAIVVGPAREGIQKKPSVRSPFLIKTSKHQS